MYIGVKDFIKRYKKEFDRNKSAINKAKSRLKESGDKQTKENINREVELVLAEWDLKTKYGEQAHKALNDKFIDKHPDTIVGEYKKQFVDSVPEYTQIQREKHYIERLVVDPQAKILGYIDYVYVDKQGYIHIKDKKTWKERKLHYSAIAPNGFKIINYFFPPLNHLIDCNWNEACLQISLYAYMLWNTNKRLKIGSLTIEHVILNESGEITDVINYEAPYLLDEVKAIIQDYKLI